MLEEFDNFIRKNVECCACGGTLEKSGNINIVELKKRATWKFPGFGHIDVPGYESRAMAVVCDECIQNKVKIKRCIEWEGTPYQVKYHDVDHLEDSSKSASQMNYYFGRLFRMRKLVRKAAREQSVN